MLPVIGSIVALWAGYSARKETRAIPPTASGDGMATAGIVMGWISNWISGCRFMLLYSLFRLLRGFDWEFTKPMKN